MDREKMVKNSVLFISCVSLLAIVWILSAIYHSSGRTEVRETPSGAPQTVSVSVSPQSARTLQDDFARIAEQSLPSVVVIRTGRTVNLWRRADAYDDVHEYYYGKRERVPTGQGSGFFVNEKGHILTNYHIIKGQEYFRAILHDGREFDAKLVGGDPLSDLAVLKIEYPGKTPFLRFADSEEVKAGHWAIAIGAPFSLSHTVTVGVVSFNRRTVGLNVHENFIQFDASINPGNSGGPLLNIEGNVIGVNDFILSPQGGNIGLGFAIAGNLAKGICSDLIEKGHTERSWVGIYMRELPGDLKAKGNLDYGVLVARVYRNSPAQRGGILPGDILLKVDGKDVREVSTTRLLLFSKRPGETVRLQILRDGQKKEIDIKTGVLSGN